MFYTNASLLKSEKDNRSTNSKETNDEEDNEITSLTNATFSTNLEKSLIPSYLLVIVPLLYLLSSIFSLIYFLLLKHVNNILNEVSIRKNYIPSLFSLHERSDLVLKCYAHLTSLCLLFIVIAFYVQIKQRFKVPEFKSCFHQIYTVLLIGLLCVTFHIFYGYNSELKEMFPILISDSNQLYSCNSIFIFLIITSILYNAYALLIMRNVAKKEEGRSKSSTAWLGYCTTILIVLIALFVVYFWIGVQIENVNEILSNGFKNKGEYLYIVLPYFIHIFNGLMISSNYFVLQYLNVILKQNINMDYLFIGNKSTS